MAHKITIGSVDFEQVEVDLDYSDIQENLDLSNYIEVDDLEYQIEYHLPNMEEECTQQAEALLRAFIRAEVPCGLGDIFIEAVQKAMTWQGDRYIEPAFTNSAARDTLRQEVRTVLKEIFYDMETTVSNRHTIAEGR